MSALSPTDDHFEPDNDDRDYSTRLGDVLGNSDEEVQSESDSEGFVYNGEDAEPSGPYREQLSEILEQNLDDLDEIEDYEHVGKLPQRDVPSPFNLAEPEQVSGSHFSFNTAQNSFMLDRAHRSAFTDACQVNISAARLPTPSRLSLAIICISYSFFSDWIIL